jgi:hypothetical protein
MSNLKTFKGSNVYTEIGVRGDEVIGGSINFVTNPIYGMRGVEVRFAAYSNLGEKMEFTHFTPRGKSKYKVGDGELSASLNGARLNKFVIKICDKGPIPNDDLYSYTVKHGLMGKFIEYLTVQVVSEGFLITPGVIEQWVNESLNVTTAEPAPDWQAPDLAEVHAAVAGVGENGPQVIGLIIGIPNKPESVDEDTDPDMDSEEDE